MIFFKGQNNNLLLEVIKEFLSKTKAGRLLNSFIGKEKGRKGQCTPELCETLDGKKGSACCKLGYTCPFLCETSCGIYNVRLKNCRVFPANEADLKLVKNCGYSWK
jgi:Fe-S-cluster containining protein